jgi:secreted PhoX family phosphatase
MVAGQMRRFQYLEEALTQSDEKELDDFVNIYFCKDESEKGYSFSDSAIVEVKFPSMEVIREVYTSESRITCIMFSEDGKTLFIGKERPGTIEVFNL